MQTLEQRKAHLETVRAALKTEFFGIDNCIDAVIDSIKTWHLMPELLDRPVVVGLWGMTGVGKTALVRSLVRHLQYTSRFVEIQMDAFSQTSGEGSICNILRGSSIQEGETGIVLLDEFQRFRTIDNFGNDIKVERYADVWMLLSDGRFPSDYDALVRMEDNMRMWDYWDDNWAASNAEAEATQETIAEKKYYRPVKYQRKYATEYGDAKKLKAVLRFKETLDEIMKWSKEKTRQILREAVEAKNIPPIDYSKCLIFVSGNLDEAFKMSNEVEDCDTNADIYHEYTKKISAIEIKQALTSRFKPEQIARLGNNHVIYPSLGSGAYMSIIKRSCREYVEQATKVFGIAFDIKEGVYQEIYENSVYPAQGTRPVFTSIHKLFGSPLSDAIFWAKQLSIKRVTVDLNIKDSVLIFSANGQECRVKVDLEIRKRRTQYSEDYNALVAVHEAGHAIVYAALFKIAPVEVAISVASFKGGYNRFSHEHYSKEETLHAIAVGMGGIVAEELVFGQELRSTGCASDIRNVTRLAADYVRTYAMDGYTSYVTEGMVDTRANTDMLGSSAPIDAITKAQKEVAQTLLTKHRDLLIDLSKHLLGAKKMDAKDFVTFIAGRLEVAETPRNNDINGDYANRLKAQS